MLKVGIITRDIRTAGNEVTHENLKKEIENRCTQLKRIDRPVMIIWDQMGNSHENVVFGKNDHFTVEQNNCKGTLV